MPTGGDMRLRFDPQDGYGDLIYADRDLERDQGFETAVLTSLFSNVRAGEEDELPDADGSREGWWADAIAPQEATGVGSKLWLLQRAKPIPRRLLPRAEQYCREALQWMLDDGVAGGVTVRAYLVDSTHLQIDVEITRPKDKSPLFYRWYYNWQAQSVRRE